LQFHWAKASNARASLGEMPTTYCGLKHLKPRKRMLAWMASGVLLVSEVLLAGEVSVVSSASQQLEKTVHFHDLYQGRAEFSPVLGVDAHKLRLG